MKTLLLTWALAASAVAGYSQTLTNQIIMVIEGDTLRLYTNVTVLPSRLQANAAPQQLELVGSCRWVTEWTDTNSIKWTLVALRIEHLMTNLVKLLCEQREVCKVFGHQWRSFLINYDYGFPPAIQQRTCGLCGKTETQSPEWK